MKTSVVCASVNELENLHRFSSVLKQSESKLIIIDEGSEGIRDRNLLLLDGLEFEFYGPRERKAWFEGRFPEKVEYSTVIPERSHAETSFGFLVAFEEGAEIVIEIDDDVFPYRDISLVDCHLTNLSGSQFLTISSPSKWYNTLQNLMFDKDPGLFPRGHPYSADARSSVYSGSNELREPILNMGLWAGDPDLDASTLLQIGGLNGKSPINSKGVKESRIIVDKGTYFAVCSMNTAFRSKIIPGFYQLYMKHLGIDRFDDIWSGLFIKKIADHLGDSLALGAPVLFHEKRPRSVFKDLRAELEGIMINETLWRVIDSIQLEGSDYYSCYSSLVEGLRLKIEDFPEKLHQDFLKMQVEKMRLWLEVVDRIA